MKQLKLNVSGQRMFLDDEQDYIVEGSVNYLEIVPNFLTNDWDKCDIIVGVFEDNNHNIYREIMKDGAILVPSKVLEGGNLSVSLKGYTQNLEQLITTNSLDLEVDYTNDAKSDEDLTVYEKILRSIYNATYENGFITFHRNNDEQFKIETGFRQSVSNIEWDTPSHSLTIRFGSGEIRVIILPDYQSQINSIIDFQNLLQSQIITLENTLENVKNACYDNIEKIRQLDASKTDRTKFELSFEPTENGRISIIYDGKPIAFTDLGKSLVIESGYYDVQRKSIVLVFQSGEKIYIPASDLIDVYYGSIGTQVVVSVSSDNVISATLVNGSIGRVLLDSEVNEILDKYVDIFETEHDREVAESQRVLAETTRNENEEVRKANELQRIANEETRKNQEQTRQSNESSREESESLRATVFANNESARQQTFNNNESTRQETFTHNETERQNEFERNEQNRENKFDTWYEGAKDTLDHKADIDGYYPSLYAGNLTSESGESISGEFVSRQTANGNNIADGKAEIKKIYGNSKRLNQLLSFDMRVKNQSTSYYNISRDETNKCSILDALNGASARFAWINKQYPNRAYAKTDHVYVILGNVKATSETITTLNFIFQSTLGWTSSNMLLQQNVKTLFKGLIYPRTNISSDIYKYVQCYLQASSSGTYKLYIYDDFMFVDLTQLYNGNTNIPHEIVEFNTDGSIKSYSIDKFLEENPEYNNYVEYNEGSIEGVKPKELKSTGKNLWDGNYAPFNNYVYREIAVRLRKGISYTFVSNIVFNEIGLSNATSDKKALGTIHNFVFRVLAYSIKKKTFTPNQDCWFYGYVNSRDTGFSEPTDKIVMIYEGSDDDKIVEYTGSSLPIAISKYFPNGMHKFGDVRDEFDLKKGVAVQRVTRLDLSEKKYYKWSENNFFCVLPESKTTQTSSSTIVSNIEVNKGYTTGTYSDFANPKKDNIVALWTSNGTNYLGFRNTSFTDETLFENSFNNTFIYFEMANPIETPIAPEDLQILYNAFNKGTETFIYEDGDYPTEVPCEILYQENLKKNLQDLPKNYYNKVQVDDKVKEIKDMIDDGSFDTYVGITGEITPYYDFVGIKDNPKLLLHLVGQSLRNYVHIPNNFSITQNGITISYDSSSQEFTINGTTTGSSAFNFFLPVNINLDDFSVGEDLTLLRYYTSPTKDTCDLNFSYNQFLLLEGGHANSDGTGTIGRVSHRITQNAESLYDDYISATGAKQTDGTGQLIVQFYKSGMSYNNFKFKLGLYAGTELKGFIKGSESETKATINVYNSNTHDVIPSDYSIGTKNGLTFSRNEKHDAFYTKINGTATSDTTLLINQYSTTSKVDKNEQRLYFTIKPEGECILPEGKSITLVLRNYVNDDTVVSFSFDSNNIGIIQQAVATVKYLNTNYHHNWYITIPNGAVFEDFCLLPYVSTIGPCEDFIDHKKILLKTYQLGAKEEANLEFEGIPYGVLLLEHAKDTMPALYARNVTDGKRTYIEYDSESSSPNQAISDLRQRVNYVDSPFYGKTIAIWGDSRESNNPDSNPTGGGDQKDSSWPALLSSTLGCNVLNFGVSGGCLAENTYQQATTQAIVNRVNTDDATKTADILVVSSMNDFKLGTPLGDASITNQNATTYYGALNLTIQRLQTKYPKKKILFVIPQKRFDEEENYGPEHNTTYSKAGSYAAYRQAQILVCQWHGIKYVDLYTEFPGTPKYANGVSGALSDAYKLYYLNDTHFSAVGNQFVADLVGRALASDSTAGTDFTPLPPLPRESGSYQLGLSLDNKMIPKFNWSNNGGGSAGGKIIDIGNYQVVEYGKVFPKITKAKAKEIFDAYSSIGNVTIKWSVMSVLPIFATIIGSDNIGNNYTIDFVIHNEYLYECSFTTSMNDSDYCPYKIIQLGTGSSPSEETELDYIGDFEYDNQTDSYIFSEIYAFDTKKFIDVDKGIEIRVFDSNDDVKAIFYVDTGYAGGAFIYLNGEYTYYAYFSNILINAADTGGHYGIKQSIIFNNVGLDDLIPNAKYKLYAKFTNIPKRTLANY